VYSSNSTSTKRQLVQPAKSAAYELSGGPVGALNRASLRRALVRQSQLGHRPGTWSGSQGSRSSRHLARPSLLPLAAQFSAGWSAHARVTSGESAVAPRTSRGAGA
jgi:hypothetical protein